jgi:hypothetical protein
VTVVFAVADVRPAEPAVKVYALVLALVYSQFWNVATPAVTIFVKEAPQLKPPLLAPLVADRVTAVVLSVVSTFPNWSSSATVTGKVDPATVVKRGAVE